MIFVTIKPISPPGKSVRFGLLGSTKFTRSGTASQGGWQVVDRPRRQATLEWVDYGPWSQTFPLRLTSLVPGLSSDVETDLGLVEGWEKPIPSGAIPQPPVLQISGPIRHPELPWVLQTLTELDNPEPIRDPTSGRLLQIDLSITCFEYVSPTIALASPASPAAAAQQRAAAPATSGGTAAAQPSGKTYTVVAGDTLSAIAARLLGNYARWPDIAKLNNLRDPNFIVPGQVLQIPAS